MATMIRLGTAIESGLRQKHRECGGDEPNTGFYQRLITPDKLVLAFKTDCGYDLTANSEWNIIREVMVHRHLYAHRSGLVDAKYVEDLRTISGEDIEPRLLVMGYPSEEVYWFEPLKRLSSYIENCRRFFRDL